MEKLVSIIVPIYCVEDSIEKCLYSLFNQTYKNIEYIFVNDASPDGSVSKLQKIAGYYPEKKHLIKIIQHERNLGLGIARQSGFYESTGDYIIHMDSDDWCELDMIEILIRTAEIKNVDIVTCNYFVNYRKYEIVKRNINFSNIDDFFKKILSDELPAIVWNKLVKRKCYQNIVFPKFNLGEDLFVTLQLIRNASSVCRVDQALIHYNQENTNSITKGDQKNLSDEIKSYCEAVKSLLISWDCFEDNKANYYTGILSRTLVMTNGYHVKDALKYIEPKAYNIFYLWKLQNRSPFKKIVYSLSFIGLDSSVVLLKKIFSKVK